MELSISLGTSPGALLTPSALPTHLPLLLGLLPQEEFLSASSHTGAPSAVPDTDEVLPCCPLSAGGLWQLRLREVIGAGSPARAGANLLSSSLRNASEKQTFGLCPEDNTGGKYIPPINMDLTVFLSKLQPLFSFAKEPLTTAWAWVIP